ncbi:MAG: lipopolysaccharide biosynthesis protein [Candidatus Sigynarchaeota archaeon]
MAMLARKSLILLVTTFFIKGVDALIFYFATNKYESTEFAYLGIVRSLFMFYLLFGDLNLNLAHVKKMAEEVHSKNTYFSTYFTFKLILLPIVSIFFILLIQVETGMGLLANNPLMNDIVVIIFISSIINSINLVYQGSFQAEMNISKMQAGNVVAITIKSVLTIVIVLFVEGFIYFVFLFILYELITLCINLILGRAYRFTRINRGLMSEYIKYSMFFLISTSIQIFYTNFGPLVLANILGIEMMGVYYVVARLLNFFTIILNSFNALFLPQISSSFKSNNLDDIRMKIMLYQRYMLIIWGIIVITCFGIGTLILRYLGGTYEDEGLVFFLFETVFFVQWAWMPYYLLIMLKRDPVLLFFLSISLILSFISWIFLPSFLGIIAIEFGEQIATVLNAILITCYVQKKYGFGKPTKSSLITILLGAILIIIAILLDVHRLRGLYEILITLAMLGVFITLLFIFKVLKKEDITFIKKVINPKDVLSEVLSDLKY